MAISKPVAQTLNITVPANSNTGPMGFGTNTFVRCISSNQAGTPFEIQMDQAPPMVLDQGLGVYCAPGDSFSALNIINTSGAALTLTLVFGQGNMTDSRASFTNAQFAIAEGGNTALVSAAGALHTDLEQVGGNAVQTGTGASGNGVPRVTVSTDSVLASQKMLPPSNAGVEQQANKIGGSQYFSNTLTGASTLVAPSSNTNGIIVRGGSFLSGSSSNYIALCGGTSAPTGLATNPAILTTLAQATLPQDRYIPAGQGLYFYALGSGAAAGINYDIL